MKSGENKSILDEILGACKSAAADLNVRVKLGTALDLDQFNLVAVGGFPKRGERFCVWSGGECGL
jgi:hypothetical protein